jgi:arabinofuranosyltransferase
VSSRLRLVVLVLAALAVANGLDFGASTQDDAFISFRYAENLLNGHGLVYNPGEAVEGISNISWTLLMAGFMGIGADPVATSILLGLLSVAALVAATAWLAREDGLWWLVAPTLVALDSQMVLEGVQGLEGVALGALNVVGAGLALKGRHRAAAALFALGVLTRPEAPLVPAMLYGGLLLHGLRVGRGRQALKEALGVGAALAAVLGLVTLWRYSTYGELLPNTYYAKTGGFAVPRGLVYLKAHMVQHGLLWTLVLMRPLLGTWSPRTWALAIAVLGQTLWTVQVGGDFKPTGRFLLPVLGLMAVLACESATLLASRLQDRVPAKALAGLLALLAALNYGWMKQTCDVVALDRHANLDARQAAGNWLAQNAPTGTWLATHSAGAIPFYSGLPAIDMWGLNDKHIARTVPDTMGQGLPGHEKTDPDYVFSREPDLYIPEDWVVTLKPRQQEPGPGFPPSFSEEYVPLSIDLGDRWFQLWVRRDSEKVGGWLKR